MEQSEDILVETRVYIFHQFLRKYPTRHSLIDISWDDYVVLDREEDKEVRVKQFIFCVLGFGVNFMKRYSYIDNSAE